MISLIEILLALEVILNVTHYFFMKIPNKKELKQTASIHLPYIDFKDFMKLYKDYTKELYSFLLKIQLCHQIIHDEQEKTYYKIVLVRKLKQSITKSSKTKLNTN